MIQVYDSIERDFESNGSAVLAPTSCAVREEAGSIYEIDINCPIDQRGTWEFLKPGNIVKAPVPPQKTQTTLGGDTVDVWLVTAKSTALRATAQEPEQLVYSRWNNTPSSFKMYYVGDKVTYQGQNYYLKTAVGTKLFTPPPQAKCWVEIANYRGGGELLATLKTGDEVFYLEDKGAAWIRCVSTSGIEGYIKRADAVYDRSIKPEAQPERTVSTQLFRIERVNINSKSHTVSASGRHASYDLAGDIVGECVFTSMPPASALALIKERLYDQRNITLSTNLTTDVDGAFTMDLTHKNGINALLDPDTGFVSYYKAKLIRDNWDMFVYRNDKPDSGVVLRYGQNLRGVTWNISDEHLITRVMPVAKNADGGDLYISNRWVDSPLIDTYPVVRMEVLRVNGQVGKDDGAGGIWTEETLTDYMIESAQKRFDIDNCDKLSVEIKVDFTLLGDTVEYAQYRGLQKLHLYDTVRVVDPTIGLDLTLQLVKYEWDALHGRYTSITLGDIVDYSLRSIAGYEISNGTINYNKLSPEAIAKIREA